MSVVGSSLRNGGPLLRVCDGIGNFEGRKVGRCRGVSSALDGKVELAGCHVFISLTDLR